MRIEHYDTINRTPAVELCIRGHVELLDTEHCSKPGFVLVQGDHSALVAFATNQTDGDIPIGVLSYEHDAECKHYEIKMGYVLPGWRGATLVHEIYTGRVYDLLWDALVRRAQAQGVPVIMSSTFMTNAAMRKVATRQGRVEQQVILRYDVPKPEPVDTTRGLPRAAE